MCGAGTGPARRRGAAGSRRRPRRARAGAGDPALRPRDHQGCEVGRRGLHRPSHQGPRLLRDSQVSARKRVPLGQPDCQDDARRRLRWTGRRQSGRPLGAARRPHLPPRHFLRRRRGRRRPDRAGRGSLELQPDRDGVQHRGARQGRRRGHRRDATVHERRPRVQRPHARRRPRVRRQPLVRRADGVVPREHRDRGDAHLQQSARHRGGRRARRTARARRRPRRDAAPDRHAQRADALQHGAAPGKTHAAAAVRRTRRLLLGAQSRLRPRRAPFAAAPLHHAVAAGEEGSERGALRAGQADRLLDRSGDPEQVGAVHEEGRRELAAGVRGRRVQERDHRQGSADARAGSRLEPGGRALLGDPVAAVHDRERVRSAHQRPALGRDHRERHPVLPQRHEPGAELVLRAGRSARPSRQDAAAARRSDGAARRIRRRPRGRPHARLPAQHEGQLDVSGGEGPRPRVGQEDGPHADADGLLALQLRRAARGQHRCRRPRAGRRALRQVGDDVGLQADPDCEVGGRREEDPRRVGPATGRDRAPALLHDRLGGRRSGRADRSGR